MPGDLAQFGVACFVLRFVKLLGSMTPYYLYRTDETGLVDGAVCVCHLRVDALYGVSVSDDGTALHENELCRKCVERDGGNAGVFQTWERSECAVDRESDGEHYAVWLCAAGSVAAVPLHPLPELPDPCRQSALFWQPWDCVGSSLQYVWCAA